MHTTLMEASMDDHIDVARLLLNSDSGHFDLDKLLIERDANLEEVNDEEYTWSITPLW